MRALHGQQQQSLGRGRKVADSCFAADRGGQGRRADFIAFQDQVDAEAAALVAALADQVEVARLEDPQCQLATGKEHGVEGEQRQVIDVHGAV